MIEGKNEKGGLAAFFVDFVAGRDNQETGMRERLSRALREAEHSVGWTSNQQGPWTAILGLLEESLGIPQNEIHAAKIQKRSARKTLWQGRLHRAPSPRAVFLAADDPCDEKSFDALSASIEERFLPPSTWADGCFVVSGGELLGYVERDGVNLSGWLQPASVRVAVCEKVSDQMELRSHLRPQLTDPDRFVSLLERSVGRGSAKEFLASSFGLEPRLVLASMAGASANAAKSRWEGRDVDPEIRYRLGLVGAERWRWGNAALEIMGRMGPADLSIEVALLFAKPSDNGEWSRVRAFVSRTGERRKQLIGVLRNNGIEDIRLIDAIEPMRQDNENLQETVALRVRDSDAGEVRYEVSRPKRRVHDLLTNWLQQWGLEQALEISEGSDSISMYDALVMREDGSNLLIEVKSSAAPGVVRLAIGQLIDYRRVLARNGISSDGILLIPETEKLTDELKDLLVVAGFSWGVLLHDQDDTDGIILELHHPDGVVETIP